MKPTIQMIFLFSALVCLAFSAPALGNPQSAQGDLPEDSPTISKPGHPITAPEPETEYAMKIIKPSPRVDYKIVYVTPDPNINYTIRNVGPKMANPFMGRNDRHDGIDRKGWRRK